MAKIQVDAQGFDSDEFKMYCVKSKSSLIDTCCSTCKQCGLRLTATMACLQCAHAPTPTGMSGSIVLTSMKVCDKAAQTVCQASALACF
jgi:hypothetical protein